MKIPEQIHAGLIDGAVVLGGTGTEDFRRGAYGIADRMKQAPMQFDSVFDIASLTKVTGTAVLLAFCVEEGIIDLNAPFTEYLPYHGRLFSPVTVRQLATHYSGIQINYPYFPGEEKKMIEAILSLDFVRPPMTEYEYTCTNYILLGFLIERVMKKPLEQLAEERIFRPLGMNDTKWGAPVDGALSRTIRTINAAPGVISDHGARAIAPHRIGNAGIFSTASDLAKFCRMMLNRGRGFFKTDIAELFFTNQAPPGMTPRSIGWNMAPDFIPEGCSASTIHHTGWTGQAVWIDPAKQRFLILLTNRFGDSIESWRGRLAAAQEIFNTIV